MKKVKYIWHNYVINGMSKLTTGKVYDVSMYNSEDKKITISNDSNMLWTCYISDRNTTFFIDVTEEYRNEVIDNILN